MDKRDEEKLLILTLQMLLHLPCIVSRMLICECEGARIVTTHGYGSPEQALGLRRNHVVHHAHATRTFTKNGDLNIAERTLQGFDL